MFLLSCCCILSFFFFLIQSFFVPFYTKEKKEKKFKAFYLQSYIYMYVCVCLYTNIYIYIYEEGVSAYSKRTRHHHAFTWISGIYNVHGAFNNFCPSDYYSPTCLVKACLFSCVVFSCTYKIYHIVQHCIVLSFVPLQ